MAVSQHKDIDWFRTFVGDSRWRFAKTYVESYPHEYTLEDWVEDEAFLQAIEIIERWGVTEAFWNARRKYLYVDERKYWHMGDASSTDPEEQPDLINRTWVEVANYRDEAKRLGYDEQAVPRLVVRWRELLAKARRS